MRCHLPTALPSRAQPQGDPGSRPDLAAGLLGLCFLALYLRTLCPTVYVGDAGEIATAIATGGVAHPPGYPIFSLLGKLFLLLIPVGEPAFRIGCVAAVAGAGAVVGLYSFCREVGASRTGSLVAAAVFGTGYTFWSQCTRVEVYSFHIWMGFLVLLGAVRYRRTGGLRDLALAALAAGVGIGHHITIVLLAPGALVLCGRRLWCDPGLARRLGLATLLIAIGPLSYFLLWHTAAAQPLHNWGRPETPLLLWNHATGKLYRINLQLPDPGFLRYSLSAAGRYFLDNFPYGLGLLAVPGAWWLWRTRRDAAVGLLAAAGVVFGYNQCYRIIDLAPYYLIVWGCTAVLLARGWDWAAAYLPAPCGAPRLAWACAALLVCLPLGRNYAAADLSRATWARELARQNLECVEPNGVLLSYGDPDTFPLWYVQELLRVRRDVLVLDRALVRCAFLALHTDPSEWYFRHLQQRGVPVPTPAPRNVAARVSLADHGWLFHLAEHELADRPWFLTCPGSNPAFNGNTESFRLWVKQSRQVEPQGTVLRLYPRGTAPAPQRTLDRNRQLWTHIRVPDLGGVRLDQEAAPAYVPDTYARMLVKYGRLHERTGLKDAAAALYHQALAVAPRNPDALREVARVGQRSAALSP